MKPTRRGRGMTGRTAAAVVALVALIAPVYADADSPLPAGAEVEQTAITQTQHEREERLPRLEAEPKGTATEDKGAAVEPTFWIWGDNYFALQATKDSGVEDDRAARVKFRIGIRYDMMALGQGHHLAWALTYQQKSFWDLLDFDKSSPFVENDYQPGTFLAYRPARRDRTTEFAIGVQHESNGIGGNVAPDSRGWNQVFGDVRVGTPRLGERSNVAAQLILGGRLWWPFAVDAGDKDRDDMIASLGYFELRGDLVLRFFKNDKWGRLSQVVVGRRRSIETTTYYPLAAITRGYFRPSLLVNFFIGEAERLIVFDKAVAHVYVGIGLQ